MGDRKIQNPYIFVEVIMGSVFFWGGGHPVLCKEVFIRAFIYVCTCGYVLFKSSKVGDRSRG